MPRRPQVEFKAVYSPDMDRMVKALQIVLRRWDTQEDQKPECIQSAGAQSQDETRQAS